MLQPISPNPLLPVGVERLVPKVDGDAALVERKQLLSQPVLRLARPLAREELDDRVPALELRP